MDSLQANMSTSITSDLFYEAKIEDYSAETYIFEINQGENLFSNISKLYNINYIV